MGEIRRYTGIDKNTYEEITKIAREQKNLSKSEIIKNVENVAKSDGDYTQSEKKLVQSLKDQLTDKNNTIELQGAKIDPVSHKINFSLKLQGEKGLLQKGIDTVTKGFSKLDIPLIKDAKAVAKEEVMNKISTYSGEVAGKYIDSNINNSTIRNTSKTVISSLGIGATTVLATGVDLVPDNYLTAIPSVLGFSGKTTKAVASLDKGKITTSLSSGGKTSPLDFRFINLNYKNEGKISEAYKLIKESKTDVKAIATYLRNDKELANPKQLEKIKKYLFDNKEFQPEPDIAMAWHRLRTGKGTEADKMLLKHEKLEISIREANPSMGYKEAHTLANKTYNWQKMN